MGINPIEAKQIATDLGFNQAKVLAIGNSILNQHFLLPLLCNQDNQTCEISLRLPGGIALNSLHPNQSGIEVNNGSNITGCKFCPRLKQV